MAQIYNSDLTEQLIRGAKIQQNKDFIPNQIADKVVPVMEVNPRLLKFGKILANAEATNATTTTLYSVPTNKDTFITGLQYAYIKDATSTSTFGAIDYYQDGAVFRLVDIPLLTLTAGTGIFSIIFPHPIKPDKGSIIYLKHSTNVANMTSGCVLFGYQNDNPNA
jgi:hypothetical protein